MTDLIRPSPSCFVFSPNACAFVELQFNAEDTAVRISRRDVLRMLGSAGSGLLVDPRFLNALPVSPSSSFLHAPQNAATPRDRFGFAVNAYATAYELRDRPETRERTVRALAHIFAQSQRIRDGLQTPEGAASEIRHVIETERGLAPYIFEPAAAWLDGTGNHPMSDIQHPNLWLPAITRGTTAGVFGTLGSFYGGFGGRIILSILDQVARDVTESATRTVLRPNDEGVLSLNAWAVYKLLEHSRLHPEVTGSITTNSPW